MIREALSALLDRARVHRNTDPEFSKPFVVFKTAREDVFVQFGTKDTLEGPRLFLSVPAGGCGRSAVDWRNILHIFGDRDCVQEPLDGMPHFTVDCNDLDDACRLGVRIFDYFNLSVVDVETEMEH